MVKNLERNGQMVKSTISVDEYLKDKIFTYCNQQVEKGQDITGYNVAEYLKDDWWKIAMVFYGQWVQQNSEDLDIKEFSDTEW